MGAIAFITAILAYTQPETIALTYPTIVSFILALIFTHSLLSPPTMIERIARRMEPNLNKAGVIYTRRVTQIWLGFFIFNGALSWWLASFASLEAWTLYTGGISYLVIGLLFLIEYLYRQRVKHKHIGNP